jgi:hypothetical protein
LTPDIEAAPSKRRPDDRWVTVAELADSRGVTVQSVHQALKRWAKLGAPVSTRKKGHEIAINLREYEKRRGEVGSLPNASGQETVRLRNQDAPEPPGGADTIPIVSYGAAQARKTTYDAELKKLDLEQQLGRLVETSAVAASAEMAAATMAGLIERLHMRAEEIYSAGQRDGLVGVRTALKIVRRDLMSKIADEFAKMAAAAIGKE